MTGECIKGMWCVYAMVYHSAMKKNETIPFAETWMALEVVILSEVSQRKTSVI